MSKDANPNPDHHRPVRCLGRAEAARYLGIGTTLLARIGPPPIKLGRRRVYDMVDLDQWLDDYKSRGRAIKEDVWPVNEDSIRERTLNTGGSTLSLPMDAEYAKALGLSDAKTPKNT